MRERRGPDPKCTCDGVRGGGGGGGWVLLRGRHVGADGRHASNIRVGVEGEGLCELNG